MTTGVAARELGVSTASISRWVAAGVITPAERTAGGHFRWYLDDLRAQLHGRVEPVDPRRVLAEDIASVIHDANRRLQIIEGDPRPSPLWDDAPERQTRGATDSVVRLLDDPERTAEQNHQGWMDDLIRDGWTRGAVKDETTKTHPLLVPFGELPVEAKRKDYMFVAIVRALTRD